MDDLGEISAPLAVSIPEVEDSDVAALRQEMGTAKRDMAGFVEGDMPHLSIEQAVWIATRSTTMTDVEACAQTSVSLTQIGLWRRDPGFVAILQEALSNKREGFRMLGTQVLPKALLTMVDKMDSKNERVALQAAKMLAETQGMLITTINKQSRDSIVELVAFLREPQEVVANTNPNIRIRGLPSPEDLENHD
jgi:hypothetical protein